MLEIEEALSNFGKISIRKIDEFFSTQSEIYRMNEVNNIPPKSGLKESEINSQDIESSAKNKK